MRIRLWANAGCQSVKQPIKFDKLQFCDDVSRFALVQTCVLLFHRWIFRDNHWLELWGSIARYQYLQVTQLLSKLTVFFSRGSRALQWRIDARRTSRSWPYFHFLFRRYAPWCRNRSETSRYAGFSCGFLTIRRMVLRVFVDEWCDMHKPRLKRLGTRSCGFPFGARPTGGAVHITGQSVSVDRQFRPQAQLFVVGCAPLLVIKLWATRVVSVVRLLTGVHVRQGGGQVSDGRRRMYCRHAAVAVSLPPQEFGRQLK